MKPFPSFPEVRAKIGGLKGLMTMLGDNPPHDHKWKVMPKCPFCGNGNCSGVYNKGGFDQFKCHHTSCSSGGAVMTEVEYLAMRRGVSNVKPVEGGPAPAYRLLLEMAGLWQEPAPREDKKPPAPAWPKPEELDKALPNPVIPSEGTKPEDDDELMLAKCIEVIRLKNKASTKLLRKHLHLGYGRATKILEELEKRGVVGPANGEEPREVLKLPDKPANLMVVKLGDEISIEELAGEDLAAPLAPQGVPTVPSAPPADPAPKSETPSAVNNYKPKLPLGVAAMRWFYEKLFPTQSQMAPYLPDGEVPSPLPEKIAKKLQYRPVSLFEKRGVTSLSCEALGLRANPTGNEALLQEAKQLFPWEEVRAAGLWLESNRKLNLGRRPNAQFCGKGQIGRKPERERKGKDDKWVWGFCEPVLIPYFDEAGDLIKLRPHKGGAPGGTAAGRHRIYVPRDYRRCADIVEKFHTVVICEGEFKAIALWQTLGLGAKLQVDTDGKPLTDGAGFEPIGVAALPGISYVTNAEMMMDLERWLGDVGARRIIVAFDDEDKSDKPMRQRFDAQRDARVLAIQLSKNLHAEARVCVLPREWRNASGKADWDGALVKILSTNTQP